MPTGERNLRKGRGQKMFLFPTAREQPTLIDHLLHNAMGITSLNLFIPLISIYTPEMQRRMNNTL